MAEPRSVNGTAQTPIQGTSFLPTLDSADADEVRTSQYFEMVVNRGMYKDGWWAASLAFEPWDPIRGEFDPMTAPWELYNLEEDFTQARDVAAENPARLEELKALWWAEASRNKALPLDWRGAERFSAEFTGKPNLAGDRTTFTYPGPLAGLPEASSPDLKNKSFSVTAKVDKPLVGANLQAHLDGLRTEMRKAAENLEFEEAARLRDEVKRLKAVDLAVHDDPLARQQAVEKASDAAVGAKGRSTAGRPGQRGGNVKRRKKH